MEHKECKATVGTRRNLQADEHGLGVLLYEWVLRPQKDERQFSGQQSLIQVAHDKDRRRCLQSELPHMFWVDGRLPSGDTGVIVRRHCCSRFDMMSASPGVTMNLGGPDGSRCLSIASADNLGPRQSNVDR